VSSADPDDDAILCERGEQSGEVGGRIESQRRFDGRGELLAGEEAPPERVSGLGQRAEGDDVVPAQDLEAHRAGRQVNRRLASDLCLVRAPDAVDRPRRSEDAHRGIEDEHDLTGVGGIDRPERRGIQRNDVVGVGGDVHRPFQTRHVGQIGEMPARGKIREKLGELGAVLEQARALRWMAANERVGGVREEPGIDEPADDGIRRGERGRQRGEDVMTVDVEPGLDGNAVGRDEPDEILDGIAEERAPQIALELTE